MNYVLVGDIHSQFSKLQSALNFIESNIENPYIIFLGDAFDSRCSESKSVEVYKTIKNLQENDKAMIIHSNHQWKLQRYLYGNAVKVNQSLQRTLDDFNGSDVTSSELLSWLESLPFACAFKDNDDQEYRCAHAYFSSKLLIPRSYDGIYCVHKASRQMRDKLIYGALHHGDRLSWWETEPTNEWIRVSGHYHEVSISYTKRSLVLDSCCGDENGLLSVFNVNTWENHQF